MTVPQHPDKHEEPAVVTAEQSVEYFYDDPPAVPERVILCFHDGVLEYVTETYETTGFEAFGDGHVLDSTEGRVGVIRVPGVGAPATSLVMEELIARGTGTFVSVGHVGSLQPEVSLGDLVVVDRALRDEGTSHHYREPDEYAEADPDLVERFESHLDDGGADYRTGTTWTTDAPHRETASEIERYRSEGILTVDMEAAAVFAIAEARGASAGALFTISDHLDPEDWEPRFADTEEHLERTVEHAIDGLR